MGMMYDATFHNAVIPPENYGLLIGWTREEAEADPERAAELALSTVLDALSDDETPTQGDEGIDLSSCGLWEHASYGSGNTLDELLLACNVGAYIECRDVEEGQYPPWRVYVTPDGGLLQVDATIVWPDEPDFAKNKE